MSRHKITDFDESAALNVASYRLYRDQLLQIATACWIWEPAPPTIDQRFLELTLMTAGHALFFDDEVIGPLGLTATLNGNFNVYNIPTRREAYAANGYHRQLDDTNSVIVYNNYLHVGEMQRLNWYARRLYDLDRTVDINAAAQKTPIIIVCSPEERLSMLNLYKEYAGNSPVIYGNNGLNREGFTVLKTDAPFTADQIYSLKISIWNEALSFLGINSLNPNKKERLNVPEMFMYSGGTEATRWSRERARKQACEQARNVLGWDIDVHFNDDLVLKPEMFMQTDHSGEEMQDE